MNPVHVEDIAEEEDSYSDYTDDSSDYDDDDNDIEDIDEEYELDNNGEHIFSEDYLIRSYNRQFNQIKRIVNTLEDFSEASSCETHVKEYNKMRLLCLQISLKVANYMVSMLLERGSQGSLMESILQMHSYATTEVAAIKAEIDALG